MIPALAILGVVLGLVPTALFFSNLSRFLMPADEPSRDGNSHGDPSPHRVSILIPARDEESGIEACVRAALACEGVETEVVVLDDQSTDRTAEVVRSMSVEDHRVRLISGQPLPKGWNGKQFACFQLSKAASADRWVFLDADVRLNRTALRRLAAYQDSNEVGLLSAFPHQVTGTWLEKWLVPMMHVILLGYLPLQRMRQSNDVAFAAGCGQLFMTSRDAYLAAGTHEAIRNSRHDGLKLPRAYRKVGLSTDVVDGTHLASCRMYGSAREVIRGVLKNATEGIANLRLILPFSILLLGAAVLPLVMLMVSISSGRPISGFVSLVGVVVGHLPRAIGAIQFGQSFLGVMFHSVATLLFVGLQWIALVMHGLGCSVAWRGRKEDA